MEGRKLGWIPTAGHAPESGQQSRLNIEYASFREIIDTGAPLGRAVVTIIGVVAELGMRRARLEGRHIGCRPLDLDRAAILGDRRRG